MVGFVLLALIGAMFIKPLRMPVAIFWAMAGFFLSGGFKHDMTDDTMFLCFTPLAIALTIARVNAIYGR
jgi:hypothetical protein